MVGVREEGRLPAELSSKNTSGENSRLLAETDSRLLRSAWYYSLSSGDYLHHHQLSVPFVVPIRRRIIIRIWTRRRFAS